MADSRVAVRYVKSLLGLAQEHKALDRVHSDLLLLTKTLDASRELVLMLRNPVIRSDKKWKILKELFSGRVNRLTLAFFEIVCRKGREGILPQIAKEFHAAYKTVKGIASASIITATPLAGKLRKEIEKLSIQLSRKGSVELIERTDNEMIGGFILSVGDKQIDASMKSRLMILKRQFSQNPYIREF